MERQASFLTGLFLGTSVSIPLWIAIIGWIKLVIHLFTVNR